MHTINEQEGRNVTTFNYIIRKKQETNGDLIFQDAISLSCKLNKLVFFCSFFIPDSTVVVTDVVDGGHESVPQISASEDFPLQDPPCKQLLLLDLTP